ncbi:MAG: hypothetical protein ABSF26_30760 [Thermoguttaceae bacterium]|jgi:hypothetical protein
MSLVCVALLSLPLRAAEDILKLVPDSALGLVVVNRPADVDAKLQSLGRQVQLPIPGMVTLLKARSGIGAGLDDKGTVALLVLPPKDAPEPTMILLVPVTDYAKFLAPLEPENPAAAVTEVEMGGQRLVVRNIGGYAAFTDPPHREVLEQVLKVTPEVPAALASWKPWLAANDAAGLIFKPGIERLSAKVQEGIQAMKEHLAAAGQQPSSGITGQQAKSMAAAFDLYAAFFRAAEKEVAAAGLGIQLDNSGAIHVVSRTQMLPGGSWAEFIARIEPGRADMLAGLPDVPFIVAGGGTFSQAAWEAMMKMSLHMMESMPDLYGVSPEQIREVSSAMPAMYQGIRGMSMLLGQIEEGSTLFAKTVALMRVDDSEAFLARYEKSARQYSQVLEKINSPVLQPPKIERIEIDGAPALRLTMKVPQPLAGQRPPQAEQMMKVIMGPEGKVAACLAPGDKHTVVLGYGSKDLLRQTIAAVRQGKPGLVASANVAKTAALLPKAAPFVLYQSPRGLVGLVRQVLPAAMPPGIAFPLAIPDFPATPPIGLAVTAGPGALQTDLAVPPEVLTAVRQYVQGIIAKAVKEPE